MGQELRQQGEQEGGKPLEGRRPLP
jgi:hypothetical protein